MRMSVQRLISGVEDLTKWTQTVAHVCACSKCCLIYVKSTIMYTCCLCVNTTLFFCEPRASLRP